MKLPLTLEINVSVCEGQSITTPTYTNAHYSHTYCQGIVEICIVNTRLEDIEHRNLRFSVVTQGKIGAQLTTVTETTS